MSKSVELRTTTALVKEVLTDIPDTRNSDDYLYYIVCGRINAIALNMPFGKVLMNRKQYSFPAFETVRRSRQKVQETHPELAGNSKVEGQRVLNEEAFRDYARGMV